jgi:hypothetical protein
MQRAPLRIRCIHNSRSEYLIMHLSLGEYLSPTMDGVDTSQMARWGVSRVRGGEG